jgi:hypothetical protein
MSTEAALLPDPAQLPDDPAVLKQLVVQLLEELHKANERLQRQEHHMHLLLRRIYGSTSEKFDPRQGVLFDPLPGVEETVPNASPPVSAPVSKNRDRHGRGRIPDKIQREERVHDLTEPEKASLGGMENLVELPPDHRCAAVPERATRLATFDVVCRGPCPQKVRPQGATSGKRPYA